MRELKRLAGKRVIVTMPAAVVEGVVVSASRSAVVLAEAREVSEPQSPVVILGAVVIPTTQIHYVQVP